MADDRSRPVPSELANLLRADGSVSVPAEIAGDLLAIVVPGLNARIRSHGGQVSLRTRAVLLALHEANQRHEDRIDAPLPEPPMDPVDYLSAREAADRMGCSPQWVRRLLDDGRLDGHKSGGVWIVHMRRSLAESQAPQRLQPLSTHDHYPHRGPAAGR